MGLKGVGLRSFDGDGICFGEKIVKFEGFEEVEEEKSFIFG